MELEGVGAYFFQVQRKVPRDSNSNPVYKGAHLMMPMISLIKNISQPTYKDGEIIYQIVKKVWPCKEKGFGWCVSPPEMA